jgi:hypothetical protein
MKRLSAYSYVYVVKHCQIFFSVFWGYVIKQNVTAVHLKKWNALPNESILATPTEYGHYWNKNPLGSCLGSPYFSNVLLLGRYSTLK